MGSSRRKPVHVHARAIWFHVSGVTCANYDGSRRQDLIRFYAASGKEVILAQDSGNQYSEAASPCRLAAGVSAWYRRAFPIKSTGTLSTGTNGRPGCSTSPGRNG